ncbi:hypothetical protein NX794_17585 [Streptomyces sp. LP11]|uniref:Lipoprotein n=1 Tax=Streptomyces pyxinicus TaxID=2970331 RepID=A0ABT2B3D7_9ACTN|nr:hypothetical protein [Streptomyces sp. LP11]MCS0603011.1 hypothetical protein [Streptomyces sp. LP11]
MIPSSRRRSWGNRFGIAVTVTILSLIGTGCSNTMDHKADAAAAHETTRSKPTVLDVDEAREKAKAVSSQIYELINIPSGKATEPGPSISTCDQDPEHLYQTVHPWSVYGVPENELKAGFQRLRNGLPGKGWKIVQYGPDKSRDKTLQLTADSETEPFSVNAELWVSSPTAGHEKEPKILINIVSGCWRAPKGTDLKSQY